uniref:AB hydrolase-1 domain-containing protein n=1 Tax=Opuntia streptacantha TaxID=393608 RepID=A0A7C8Z2B1_OPUST
MSSGAHFVLVHGACHGAWCWYKIRCLLECAGHKVSCLDLRASGIDLSDANTVFKFQEYNQPLDDVLSGLGEGEKVILVGHSAGGLNLTAALYKYPHKIQAAVYVVAEMIRDTPQVPSDLPVDKNVFDVYYGEGPDKPPTSLIYKKELVQHHYYQRSPLELGRASFINRRG